jgi:hypothetical protein
MNGVYLLSTCTPLWLMQFPLEVSYPPMHKMHGFLYCPYFINHSLGNGHDLVPYAVVNGHAKVQVIIFWLLTMNLRFNRIDFTWNL